MKQYGTIWLEVLRNPDISEGAKVLMIEINALCGKKGVCWASNEYFARLTGRSWRTIVGYVSELERLGLIAVERSNDGQNNTRRKMRVLDPPPGGALQSTAGGVANHGRAPLPSFAGNLTILNYQKEIASPSDKSGAEMSKTELVEHVQVLARDSSRASAKAAPGVTAAVVATVGGWRAAGLLPPREWAFKGADLHRRYLMALGSVSPDKGVMREVK